MAWMHDQRQGGVSDLSPTLARGSISFQSNPVARRDDLPVESTFKPASLFPRPNDASRRRGCIPEQDIRYSASHSNYVDEEGKLVRAFVYLKR